MKAYFIKQTGTDTFVHYDSEIKEYVVKNGIIGACAFDQEGSKNFLESLEGDLAEYFEVLTQDVTMVKPSKNRKNKFSK